MESGNCLKLSRPVNNVKVTVTIELPIIKLPVTGNMKELIGISSIYPKPAGTGTNMEPCLLKNVIVPRKCQEKTGMGYIDKGVIYDRHHFRYWVEGWGKAYNM